MSRNDNQLRQPCDDKFDKSLEAMTEAQQKMCAAFRESFMVTARRLASVGMQFRADNDVEKMIKEVRQGDAENNLERVVYAVKNFAGNVDTSNVDFSSGLPVPIFLAAALALLDAAWDPKLIKDLSPQELEDAYRNTVRCRASLLQLQHHK